MSDTTKTGPSVRVRLGFSSTVKEGWRLGEATVEYTSGTDGVIDWARIEAESEKAHEVGASVAKRQNERMAS